MGNGYSCAIKGEEYFSARSNGEKEYTLGGGGKLRKGMSQCRANRRAEEIEHLCVYVYILCCKSIIVEEGVLEIHGVIYN